MKRIKVLYIHHRGNFGGSSKSLLNMIKAFPADSIDPYLICPNRGEVANIFEKNGIKVCRTTGISIFMHCVGGYYNGLRWLILLREIYHVFPTLLSLLKAHRRWGPFDIVHINEIVMILPTIIEKLFSSTPIVMHVRGTQQTKRGKIRSFIIKKLINISVNEVIAISKDESITLKGINNINIIHNGTQINEIKKIGNDEKIDLYKSYNIPYNDVIVSIIGQLQKDKGIFDFIEAARICLKKQKNITFLIIGKNAHSKEEFNSIKGKILKKLGLMRNYKLEIQKKIDKYDINENVIMTGFTLDINKFYEITDILCFPNHIEATGRPVFEAAKHEVTSIVALTKPQNDIVIENYTGICVPPHSPEILAKQIINLANDMKFRTKLGKNARIHCEKLFDINQTSRKVLELYEKVLIQ